MDDKLHRIIQDHLAALRPFGRDSFGKSATYIYFIDASLLSGDYANLFKLPMISWHIETAHWNRRRFRTQRRRYIRRLVPILDREYSIEEQTLLKFALNIQLALGSEVLVYFVDDDRFLENMFNVDNMVVVKRGISLEVHLPYDSKVPYELDIDSSAENVSDKFQILEDLSKDNENAYILKYDQHTFTCNRTKRLSKKYSDFLYRLQSGRCTISQEKLLESGMHVDHIFPRGMGGNNSLTNLQLVNGAENVSKGEKITHPRWCLDENTMARHGFTSIIHQRFNDRTLTAISLGPEALFERMSVVSS